MNHRISFNTCKIVIIFFLSICLSSTKLSAAVQAEYFVDPVSGVDSNNGLTISSAFRTITKARDVVRTINNDMTGDIVVNLRGGNYLLNTTLCFILKDAGKNGFNIFYQAYNGETPVLNGGKKISGWSLFDKKNNIYRASCGSREFRQLYVNGQRAIRARTPNREDYFSGAPFYRLKQWGDPIEVWASDFSDWSNVSQIELVLKSNWQQSRFRIDSYEKNGPAVLITSQDPDRSNYSWYNTQQAGNTYFVENSYDFLDAENEWYLDTETATVYYKPSKGTNMTKVEVVIPMIETLLKIEGSGDGEGDNSIGKVKNLVFSGITFMYSTWLEPNYQGYSSGQAALVNKTLSPEIIPGMVEIKNAMNVMIERNRFEHSGGQGLSLLPTTDSILIEGNVFTDISANGIAVDPTANRKWGSSYDIIRNNLIELCGRDYTDACGITATFPVNITITHNELRFLPYTGISLGWDWDEDDTRAVGGEISYNKIHDILQIHDDGGGYYTLGKIPGIVFEYNYIYNLIRDNWADGSPVTAVYLDEGSCFKTVRNNVMNNCDQDFNVNDQKTFRDGRPKLTHDNQILNNYHSYPLNVLGTKNTVSNNVLITDNNWPEEAIKIMNNAGLEPSFQDLKGSSIPPKKIKVEDRPRKGQNTIPHSNMKVTASNFQKPLIDVHYGTWNPENMIDDLESSCWHTSWSPEQFKLPVIVTFQFDEVYNVNKFLYSPRNAVTATGTILKYNLYTSLDGIDFTNVVNEGVWENNFLTKAATFAPQKSKYIRLEVLDGIDGYANAAEINIQYILEK